MNIQMDSSNEKRQTTVEITVASTLQRRGISFPLFFDRQPGPRRTFRFLLI